jgi:hypothetical protein
MYKSRVKTILTSFGKKMERHAYKSSWKFDQLTPKPFAWKSFEASSPQLLQGNCSFQILGPTSLSTGINLWIHI